MITRRWNFTPKSGLSLFELLIALALLAFISAALASSFGLGARLFVRSQQIAALSDELALRSRLRGWLAAATPPSQLATFPVRFKGTRESVSFVTLTPTPFAPDGAGLVISVEVTNKTLALTATAFDDEGAALSAYTGNLAQNTTQVTFSYYSADGDTPGWQDSWTNTTRLPDLVRIEMAKGSAPDWPEFAVRLLMAQ